MKSEPTSERILEGSRMAAFMEDATPSAPPSGDDRWLQLAHSSYTDSTTFFDATVRSRLDTANALWRSEHAPGSKYHSKSFEKRSKVFRPKTRTAMRKHESAVAVAFLSTADIVHLQPPNPNDKKQARATEAKKAMLSYRLEEDIRWFQMLIGGYQDASRQGFVIAGFEWDYRRATRYMDEPGVDGETVKVSEQYTIADRPQMRLIPGENFRVSPASNWADPIGTTPYIIEFVPMFVQDVEERMDPMRYPVGVAYRQLSRDQLKAGLKHNYDSVRQSRTGHAQDRYDAQVTVDDHSVIWIHRNIVRIEGEDYYYETVGTQHLLSDPVPLRQLHPRGRPYVFGHCSIEAHNMMPDSPVLMAQPIQEEVNEVANLRLDNTKMATIGRHIVRRGAQVDTSALLRMVPGGIVEVGNVQSDIRWDKAPEVGRTAYEEHNLLQTELDDLIGNFSGSSIAADRKLGETVGGLELHTDNVNQVIELNLMCYSETFVKPSLKQILGLVETWEDDAVLAAVVGESLDMNAREMFEALDQRVKTSVNVGFGSTNPMKRVQKISAGLGTIAQFFPTAMANADVGEVVQEVFGALGFRDGTRFFPGLAGDGKDDPRIAEKDQQIAELQALVDGKQMEIDGRIKVAEISAQARAAAEQMRSEHGLKVEQMRGELKKLDMAWKHEQNAMKKGELLMQREALSHSISMAEREFALQVQTTPVAPPPHAEERPIPANARELIRRMQSGRSAMPAVGGDSSAGVMARGDYGLIPGAEG